MTETSVRGRLEELAQTLSGKLKGDGVEMTEPEYRAFAELRPPSISSAGWICLGKSQPACSASWAYAS